MREESSGRVKADISRWAFAALVIGIIEGVFSYVAFETLPLAQATTPPLSYVIFALAVAPVVSIVSLSPGRNESVRQAAVLAVFLALLVFFDSVVLLRRTPYSSRFLGRGIGLFAGSLLVSLPAFFLTKRMLARAARPVPLFLSCAVVLQCAFLFLRYVNHYTYSKSIFYESPALVYNALVALLFLPAVFASARLFGRRAIEGWMGRGETGRRILLFVVTCTVIYMGGRIVRSSLAGTHSRPNILLIVLDTLRSDRLSSYGYERETSPHIDSLAAGGAIFTNAIATAPWTLPTHSSMFTGLYPTSHGAHWEHMYLDGSLRTLAELLEGAGYQTAGFSNNGIVSRATNLTQGFTDFYEMWKSDTRLPTLHAEVKDWLVSLAGRADAGAARTNELIRGWLERRYKGDSPFFMFVNYLEVHLPYKPPVHFRKKVLPDGDIAAKMEKVSIHTLYEIVVEEGKETFPLTEDEIASLSDLYDAEISYLDSKIGELVDYLRSRGILDSTFIILTSDHGENIGEHRMIDHQLALYDTLLRVPLILRYPPFVQPGTRSHAQVQSVDIFSTITDIAGIGGEGVEYPVHGKSLLGILEGGVGREVAYSEYMSPRNQFDRVKKWAKFLGKATDLSRFDRRLKAARTDSLKYVWASDGRDELYRLAGDPGELENKIGSGSGSLQAMKGMLEGWLGSLPPATEGSGEIPEMDRETRDLLKALGYID